MPIPDQNYSSLSNIIVKVRRLTRSMSENQLSDNDIINYVNTFVLYDFPEHLRLFNLHTTLTFYTQPYVDVYQTDTTDPNDPLYNFTNQYITVNPPVYIAGYNSMFSQSREQFFSIYPFVNNIQNIGAQTDGVNAAFTGTLQNVPVLQNNVLFSAIDANGNGMSVIDRPAPGNNTQGALVDALTGAPAGIGAINYVTGLYLFSFPNPPAANSVVNSQTVAYVPSLPQALLFYDGKFTLRPVPDQSYRVQLEVYKRPSQLLQANEMPQLSEWWQYIAYGAARKVLQDRMELDTVALIEPEYKAQEALILRRTIVQQTPSRSGTIYTEQTSGQYGFGYFYGGGQF